MMSVSDQSYRFNKAKWWVYVQIDDFIQSLVSLCVPTESSVWLGSRDSGNDPRVFLLGIHRNPNPRRVHLSKVCSKQVRSSPTYCTLVLITASFIHTDVSSCFYSFLFQSVWLCYSGHVLPEYAHPLSSTDAFRLCYHCQDFSRACGGKWLFSMASTKMQEMGNKGDFYLHVKSFFMV